LFPSALIEGLFKKQRRPILLPYRLGLEQGDHLPPMDCPWPEIFRDIQRILDPCGCMASSRYESLWKKGTPTDVAGTPKEADLCIS
jgi:hypothetical protein